MKSSKLPNYLRTNRKRLGLSQDEVAYLLGVGSGAKVCRYERFARDAGLATALAYEAIFKQPVRKLFAGMYEKIEQEVAERAQKLALKTARLKPGDQTATKREKLAKIAGHKTKRAKNS